MFYIGYVIIQLPAGVIADRFGWPTIIEFALLIMGVTTLATGLITSAMQGYVLRFFTGLAAGCVYAPSLRALFTHFSKKKRGATIGIFLSASNFSLLILGFSVPLVAEVFGWRWGFYATGIPSLVAGLLIFALVRRRKHDLVPSRTASMFNAPRKADISLKGYRILLANKNLWLCFLGGLCVTVSSTGSVFYVFDYLVSERGVPKYVAGSMLSAYALTGAIARLLAGTISDFIGGRRKPVIIAALLVSVPIFLVFGHVQSLFSLFILVVCLGLVVNLHIPPQNAITLETASENQAGFVLGLGNTIWELGAVAAPLIFGYAIDTTHSYFWGWASLAFFSIIGALIFAFVKENAK
jgi:MFS family permease